MGKKKKVDSYSRHEALDRTHLVLCLLDDALINHPGAKANKKAYKLIKEAEKNLMDAYQIYGYTHFGKLAKEVVNRKK